MTEPANWHVTVDRVTDALVRSHLARRAPFMTLDVFVQEAATRELDRLALLEHDEAMRRPRNTDDIREIVIPWPPKP